jgi:cell division protein FtsL
MENQEQVAAQNDEVAEVAEMGTVQKITTVFYEPSKTFTSLDKRPTWLWPVIILIVLVMITSIATRPLQIQEQIHRIDQNERLSPEQKEQFIEMTYDRMNQPFWKFFGYVIPIAGVFIYVILLTAIWYFGGNVLLGGDATFKKVLSIFSHSALVAIPGTIVKLPLMLAKQSVRIQTSLAALLPSGSDESVLFKILAKFDIFNIWQYVLFTMGLAVIYKFSVKKAASLVIGFYVAWILFSVGFSVLTKGRFMLG